MLKVETGCCATACTGLVSILPYCSVFCTGGRISGTCCLLYAMALCIGAAIIATRAIGGSTKTTALSLFCAVNDGACPVPQADNKAANTIMLITEYLR